MHVSFIIPTYNKLSRLVLTMESLMRQTYPAKLMEVVLIDDGSTDGTDEYIRNQIFPFEFHYISQPNGGRSKARNCGIKMAQHELLIFIDDDMLLPPNFVRNHIDIQMQQSYVTHGKIMNLPYMKFFQDPTRGIYYDKDTQRATNILSEQCITLKDISERFYEKIVCRAKITAFEELVKLALFDNSDRYMPWHWIGFCGGNVCVPKQWIVEMEGFDELFGTCWGCEDLELGYRLHTFGRPFMYAVDAVAYHISHYRWNYAAQHVINTKYFYEKHQDEAILVLQDFIDNNLCKEAFFDTLEHKLAAKNGKTKI